MALNKEEILKTKGETGALPLKEILETIIDEVNGGEWINITPLIGGIVETSSKEYYRPQYKKVGNIVKLRGCVTGVTARGVSIFTLPSGFYNPTRRFTFIHSNDNINTNIIRIVNNGDVQLHRTTGSLTDGVDVFLDGISFDLN